MSNISVKIGGVSKSFPSKSAAAKALVESGVGVKEAAVQVGVKYQTVFQAMNIDKIKARQKKQRVAHWAKKDKTQTWIAHKVGMSTSTVHNVLHAIMGKKRKHR